MIQKLYWIASAFPSLAMTRVGICLKLRYSAFPSLAMTRKGEEYAEPTLNCHAELVSASILLVNANLHNTILPTHTKLSCRTRFSISYFSTFLPHRTLTSLSCRTCFGISSSCQPTQHYPPYTHQIVMLNSFQHLVYFANKDKLINRIMGS